MKSAHGVWVDWDDKKSREMVERHGVSFEEAMEIYKHPFHHAPKNDDPEQYRLIGWVKGRLVTLIVEAREDELVGEYDWFVTLWNSTPSERAIYERG
jgi:uncharacterized DUF497 family protein